MKARVLGLLLGSCATALAASASGGWSGVEPVPRRTTSSLLPTGSDDVCVSMACPTGWRTGPTADGTRCKCYSSAPAAEKVAAPTLQKAQEMAQAQAKETAQQHPQQQGSSGSGISTGSQASIPGEQSNTTVTLQDQGAANTTVPVGQQAGNSTTAGGQQGNSTTAEAPTPPSQQATPSSPEDYNSLLHLIPDQEVIFAVSTGKEMVNERAMSVLDTWCSNLGACIYFSDAPNYNNNPATVEIKLSDYGFTDYEGLDVYKRAQLRFLPALAITKDFITSNKDGKFGNVKWVALVDDDTYVFYFNLLQVLNSLGGDQPVYTGNMAPDDWFPISTDGQGNDLGVSSDAPFCNGGGGSFFSLAAVMAMDMPTCLNNSLPGNLWDRWQSDWMMGQCVANAGFGPTRMPLGTFNQFACTDDDGHVHYCNGDQDGEFLMPATIHPVKQRNSMQILWSTYPSSRDLPTRDIALKRARKGGLAVMSRSEVQEYRKKQAAEASRSFRMPRAAKAAEAERAARAQSEAAAATSRSSVKPQTRSDRS